MGGVFTHRFGLNPGAAAGGVFLVGASSLSGNASGGTANFQIGSGFQAVASGTPAKMYIQGSTSGASSVAHRLCIYNASSATSWGGSLVAYTEIKTSLGLDTLQEYLVTVVNGDIIAGNWYGLSVHAEGNFGVRGTAGVDQRFASDTYADGPAATIGATGRNSFTGTYIYVTS